MFIFCVVSLQGNSATSFTAMGYYKNLKKYLGFVLKYTALCLGLSFVSFVIRILGGKPPKTTKKGTDSALRTMMRQLSKPKR